jgi:DNA invertase Pin-like site-specific DNA recombinase
MWKFNRFARSVSHLLRALETFKAQRIEFVSFSDQINNEQSGRQDSLPNPVRVANSF